MLQTGTRTNNSVVIYLETGVLFLSADLPVLVTDNMEAVCDGS